MAAKNWSKEKPFALIQQYERFSELWNITLSEYRNKKLKMSRIKEISESFEILNKYILKD